MYFVIESSPIGNNVVGNFSTKEEAEKKIDSLIPVGECFCDYYVTKIICYKEFINQLNIKKWNLH
jgi:hypothetical protein